MPRIRTSLTLLYQDIVDTLYQDIVDTLMSSRVSDKRQCSAYYIV